MQITACGAQSLALLIGGFAAIAIAQKLTGGSDKDGKIARSRLANAKEKKTARKRAIQQMAERRHNAVSLYVGTPKRTKKGQPIPSSKTIWIPDAQRGVAVVGAPGSGKTFSVINPVLRSGIDQGFPTLLFDFKYPDQSELIATYAARKGYAVRVADKSSNSFSQIQAIKRCSHRLPSRFHPR